MADMKKVYDDLIINNLYYVRLHLYMQPNVECRIEAVYYVSIYRKVKKMGENRERFLNLSKSEK